MPSWQHCITWRRCQGRVVFSGCAGLAVLPSFPCRKISTLHLDSFLPEKVLPMLDTNRPLPVQCLKRGLTKAAQCFIIQTKGKPRTRLLLQTAEYSWFTKSIRHLAEWRLLFFRSYTIIVMVYFPKWNVIRISFTSFRRCRSNRLRACCSPFSPCGYLYCNAISAYCQSVVTLQSGNF